MIPAANDARFEYLLHLARAYEQGGDGGYTHRQRKYLRLAAVYREMAAAAMPSTADPGALRERSSLAEKLRTMTVENGCTVAEAANAVQLLLKLEGDGQ
jgi:hypothetical protein